MFKRLCILMGLMIIIGMVSFTSPVSAANLQVNADQTFIETCPDKTLTTDDVKVTVKNLFSKTDTISLHVDWLTNSYSAFIKPEVVLASGEEKVIKTFWINIPYTLEPGTYTATIRATSGMTGETVSKQISIKVLGCHLIDLETSQTNKEACKETELPLVYDINVTNKGKFTETYNLSVLSNSKTVPWAAVSQNTITVNSGASKTVSVMLNPPSTLSGVQNIDVYAESMNSYAKKSMPLTFNLKQCFDFSSSISPQRVSDICLGRTSSQILRISNTGSRSDIYSIETPSWVSSMSNVTIAPGRSKTVTLTEVPQKSGSNSMNVIVSSLTNSNLRKTLTADIVAKECKDAVLMVSPVQTSTCGGETGRFTITVKNTGTMRDTFNISTSLGQLSKQSVTLDPEQIEIVDLDINTSELEGTKTLTVTATNNLVSKQSSAVLAIEKCYDSSISITPNNISVHPYTSTKFSIVVRNRGTKLDTFNVGYVLDGKTYPEFSNVVVEAGASKTLDVVFTPPVNMSSGLKRLDVFATSSHKSLTTSTQIAVKTMAESYALEVVPQTSSKTIAVSKAEVIPIMIKNTGEVSQDIMVNVSGPQWVYLRPTDINLKGKEDGITYVYISPIYHTLEGEYKATIYAVAEHSSANAHITIKVLSNITDNNIPVLPTTANNTTTVPSVRMNVSLNTTANETSNVVAINLTEPVENNTTVSTINNSIENITNQSQGEQNVVLNSNFTGDGITSSIIGDKKTNGDVDNLKMLALVIITLVIILILVVRFVLLMK